MLQWLSLWPLTPGWSQEFKDYPRYEVVRVGIILAQPFLAWLIFSLRDALVFPFNTCEVLVESNVVWRSDSRHLSQEVCINRELSVLFILWDQSGRLISPCSKSILNTVKFSSFVIILSSIRVSSQNVLCLSSSFCSWHNSSVLIWGSIGKNDCWKLPNRYLKVLMDWENIKVKKEICVVTFLNIP